MQQSSDQSTTFTLAFSSLSSHTHQSPSYTLPTVVCAVITWIKGFSGQAVSVLSLSPADTRQLTSCLSSPQCFTVLIQATQETNVNVPQMADTLMERAGNASWVVVFKALITTHHLMVHGNEVGHGIMSTHTQTHWSHTDVRGCFQCMGKSQKSEEVSDTYIPLITTLNPTWSTDHHSVILELVED